MAVPQVELAGGDDDLGAIGEVLDVLGHQLREPDLGCLRVAAERVQECPAHVDGPGVERDGTGGPASMSSAAIRTLPERIHPSATLESSRALS